MEYGTNLALCVFNLALIWHYVKCKVLKQTHALPGPLRPLRPLRPLGGRHTHPARLRAPSASPHLHRRSGPGRLGRLGRLGRSMAASEENRGEGPLVLMMLRPLEYSAPSSDALRRNVATTK